MGKLSVSFEGLISMVPLKPASDDSPAKKWGAALPDLRRTVHSIPGIPSPIPPHVACVIVPADAVVDEGEKPWDLVFEKPDGRGRFRLYELRGEALRIDYAGRSPLKAEAAPLKGKVEPGPDEVLDLRWVAQMGSMGLPQAGVFDRALIDEDYFPVDATKRKGDWLPDLRGMVHIEGGNLGVRKIVPDKKGQALVYEFRAPGDKVLYHRQAQGEHAVLDDTVDADEVRLSFGRRSVGPGGPNWRTLRLDLNAVHGSLDLRVVNLELETILELGTGLGPLDEAGMYADQDFAVHYILSAGWPFKVLPVPYPQGKGVGGGGERCKGAAFAGLSE